MVRLLHGVVAGGGAAAVCAWPAVCGVHCGRQGPSVGGRRGGVVGHALGTCTVGGGGVAMHRGAAGHALGTRPVVRRRLVWGGRPECVGFLPAYSCTIGARGLPSCAIATRPPWHVCECLWRSCAPRPLAAARCHRSAASLSLKGIVGPPTSGDETPTPTPRRGARRAAQWCSCR